MLGAIWSVIEPYLHDIFKRRLDIDSQQNSWKRTSVGKFMTLYESLLTLERTTTRLYDLFSELSEKDSVLVKTIVRKRLDELSVSVKQFVKSYQEIDSLLSIYNDPFRLRLIQMMHIKGAYWYQFEIWANALPSNKDENDKTSNFLRYTKVLPTQDIVKKMISPVIFQGNHLPIPGEPESEELKELVSRLSREIFSKIDVITIDLSDKGQVQNQLDNIKLARDGLCQIRSELASFIKDTFPLDKIMNSN